MIIKSLFNQKLTQKAIHLVITHDNSLLNISFNYHK